jgi:hypothetical protein
MFSIKRHHQLLILVGGWMMCVPAFAQTGPTSTNDRTTSENQDPNPKNPTKPPRVNTGIGSPDTPTDSVLNEGSPPLGSNAATGQQAEDAPQNQPAGATGNFGFAAGGLQTLRLSQLLKSDIVLDDGDGIGTISDIVLGQNGSLLYLLGTNNTNGAMFTIPAQAASFDFQNSTLSLPLTQQQFQSLPTFSSSSVPNFNSLAYQRQLFGAFRQAGVNLPETAHMTAPGNTAATNRAAANAGTQNATANSQTSTETESDTSSSEPPPTRATSLNPDPKSARERAFDRLEDRQERRAARDSNDNRTTDPNSNNNNSNVTTRKPPLNQPAHAQSESQRNARPPGGARTTPAGTTGAANKASKANTPNRPAASPPGSRPTPAANAPKPQNRLPGPNPVATPGSSGVPGSPPGGGVTGGSNAGGAGNPGAGSPGTGNAGAGNPGGAGQGGAGGANPGAGGTPK